MTQTVLVMFQTLVFWCQNNDLTVKKSVAPKASAF